MKKVKSFVEYFFLAGLLFAFIAAPVLGLLYCFAPEHVGLPWGGWIGGTIGCAISNGVIGAIAN